MFAPAYSILETEDGSRYEDPSQDHIFDKVEELAWPNNTFLTIEGTESDWYVVVSLLEEGTFEVEYKNPQRREHRIEAGGTPSTISYDVTLWIAGI
ncbi:hypothetical protein [Streptomyces sp. NPDC004592]